MYQYILLLAVPAICSALHLTYLEYMNTEKIVIKQRNPVLPIFFICFLLILALRHETIGRDLDAYKYYFNAYSQISYSKYPIFSGEWLFKWTNIFIGQLVNDYQLYLGIIAVITVLPIAYTYCQQKNHGYVQMVIFVNMSTFIMLFSGIRQSLAIAMGMIAYQFVKRKKLIWFLLFAYLALAFHHSGFMVFLMYPMYHAKLRKQHLMFVVPAIALIFIFKVKIFAFLNEILSETSDKYGSEINDAGAYMSLVLFAIITVFIYVVSTDEEMDEEAFGLRNFLVLTVALQCFASLHPLSMRLNYYYIIFIPMAVGRCLNFKKEKYKEIADLGEIVLCVFFTIYFIWNTYNSFKTGRSALDTIPYKFFWER